MTTQTAVVDGEKRTRVRYGIIFFLFVVTTINYADRASFGLAGDAAGDELGFGPVAIGFILSAFAWSYVLAQIPGGILLDRFGTKKIYGSALLLWSFFTFLQGFAGFITGLSVIGTFFALRFLVGLAEAPSFPGNARLVASWFPASERGTASAIFNSAQYFSLVTFAPLMGALVHWAGWRSVFWVMGGIGILAAVVFARFIRSPIDHPMVNKAELDYMEAGGALLRMEEASSRKTGNFNWANVKKLLANRMLIGIYLGQYCINVLTYFFVTWFPIYLVKERGMSILEAGFTAAVPALCGFIGGVLGGVLSDWLLRRGLSITMARKLPLLVGMILAMAIVLCNFVESEAAVIAFMSLAFFGKGLASLGWAVMSDVSPKELAGVAGGIFNTCGNIAGIVTPIVVGFIVAGTGSFQGALVFVGGHCLITILAYFLIVGKIDRIDLSAGKQA